MLTITGMSRSPARLRDQLHDLDRGLRIERGGGLVGEHEVRLLHQRARDADALALAAGELVGALRGEVAEPDRVEQAERAIDVRRRKLAQPGAPYRHIAEPAAQHVLDHREPLDQIVFLEHHADAPARGAQLAPAAVWRGPGRGTGFRRTVGSTSRLMQRISVDLPVPDGPMIAVMPRPATVSDTSLQHRLAGAVFLAQVADDQRAVETAGCGRRSG